MKSPQPIRRALKLSLILLLTLTLAGWVSSFFRLDQISRKSGTIIEPPAAAPTDWTFSARDATLTNFRGTISLAFSEYPGHADSREGLNNWQHWHGWSHFGSPGIASTPNPDPIVYWRGFSDFRILGLGILTTSRQGTDSFILTIPHWLVSLALAAALFRLILIDHRQRRRLTRGQCLKCGYDLRATPPPTPCPECGRNPAPANG